MWNTYQNPLKRKNCWSLVKNTSVNLLKPHLLHGSLFFPTIIYPAEQKHAPPNKSNLFLMKKLDLHVMPWIERIYVHL